MTFFKPLSFALACALLLSNVAVAKPSAAPSAPPLASATAVPAETPTPPSPLPTVDIQAAAAILVRPNGGNPADDDLLFDKNAADRRPPASLTKIMTTLIALEYAEKNGLNAEITAKEIDFADITGDSSIAGIRRGETLQLKDLLYCIMVKSANEACNMVARHVAGDVPSFVAMVNARLEAIGCADSHFVNPHGQHDPEHFTTARDLYLMVRECMKNTTFMEIAHTEEYVIKPTNKNPDGYKLITTNKLIFSDEPAYRYQPARGIKTGTTTPAGHCLCAAAEKNDTTLISVVLGAGVDKTTELVRSFTETKALFEWGFDSFAVKKILAGSTVVAKTNVAQGKGQSEVQLVPAEAIEVLCPKNLSPEHFERKITFLYPDGITAPVQKGEEMGTIELSYNGKLYGRINLVANMTIERDAQEAAVDKATDIINTPWVRWGVFGLVSFVVLYIVIVIGINVRRRNARRRGSNYRGRR